MTLVRDVVTALNRVTRGRMVSSLAELEAGGNPFIVRKDSGVPGKSVLEIPGLVWGNPDAPVRRLGIAMSMTEVTIELAHARGVDLIVAHHPVADGASSGGALMGDYLSLYGISVIECHEALHGLHPGIPWLHGHVPDRVEVAYGGIQGNVLVAGRPLPEVKTAGDILRRLEALLDRELEARVLADERAVRGNPGLDDAGVAAAPVLLAGDPERPVRRILHLFPHGGFTVAHLEQALAEHPDVDTVLVSISRVPADHPLVAAARARGLTFLAGNTHALEIFENGLPLAHALQQLLPDIEVMIFRERVTLAPLAAAAGPLVQEYARAMAAGHLLPPAPVGQGADRSSHNGTKGGTDTRG